MAFLSAGPWGRPNGAPHFGVCRFKNSEGSDHNRRACRIIGSAGSGMPGIEMCAEHDEFVGFVGSGNFADDVERIQIIIVELVLDIHFDSKRNLLVQHSPDPAIVLHGHNDLRWNGRIVRIPATATLNEYGAAAALSGFDGGDHTLIQKKLQAPLIEILRIVSTACARCSTTLSGPAATWRLDWLIREVGQILVGEPASGGLELGRNVAHCRNHDELPAELSAELFKVFIVINDGSTNIRFHRAVRARSPGFGISN